MPAATVTLERVGAGHIAEGQTDREGRERFASLPDGAYNIEVRLTGYGERRSESIIVKDGRATQVVLVLGRVETSRANERPPIDYSDEPHFTVSGVTDPTAYGAHGSDTTLRTQEALAKDTAALTPSAKTGMEARTRASSEPGSSPSDASAMVGGAKDEDIAKRLLAAGRTQEALPYLERAARLEQNGNAALHKLLAETLEREGRAVEAEQEYVRAAELDPSESNLFEWGAELLLHRAPRPALEVFGKGHRLFPNSSRMLIGLGVSSYNSGSREAGIRELIEACDLDPDNQNPYLFLGRIEQAEGSVTPAELERLKRFVALHPENAIAYYNYALAREKARSDSSEPAELEGLLRKAVALDPHLGDAYLQLGIVYSGRRDFARAASAYEKAIQNTPFPAEAHFRLAQLYRQMGKTQEARSEIRLFDEVSKQQADENERKRHEIGQFVYTLRGETNPPAAPKPQ